MIGDLVQQGITQSDESVTGAFIVLSTIGLLTVALSYLSFKFRRRGAGVASPPCRGGPGAEAVFLEGLPGPAACAWAQEAGVDLLVTAAHHGLLDRLLLGSFAQHLVNHASCPVLVVRL